MLMDSRSKWLKRSYCPTSFDLLLEKVEEALDKGTTALSHRDEKKKHVTHGENAWQHTLCLICHDSYLFPLLSEYVSPKIERHLHEHLSSEGAILYTNPRKPLVQAIYHSLLLLGCRPRHMSTFLGLSSDSLLLLLLELGSFILIFPLCVPLTSL